MVGDVLAHVHLGLQEMSSVSPRRPTATPDVDAASYWRTQPVTEELCDNQFAHIRYVRALFSAIRRPTGVLDQWRATTSALTRLVAVSPSGVLDFQDYRLRTGDFLATWAVELAVHGLDLRPDGSGLASPQVAPAALRLARPDRAERERLGPIADRLPALG